ncbi:hypothetical protein C8Q76DRAFT_713508 [Earliella scabrosa]|nr:hypothetical protein C8Q76DRAFT_713508 [Earliella scabrosa]
MCQAIGSFYIAQPPSASYLPISRLPDPSSTSTALFHVCHLSRPRSSGSHSWLSLCMIGSWVTPPYPIPAVHTHIHWSRSPTTYPPSYDTGRIIHCIASSLDCA